MNNATRVAEDLRNVIKSYAPDTQLPTYEELSKLYGVSINTIKAAMDTLRRENLIYTLHGKGSYTSSTPTTLYMSDTDDLLNKILQCLLRIEKKLDDNG